MTAHVGYPTLRLIRYRVSNYTLDNLSPGEYQIIGSKEIMKKAKTSLKSILKKEKLENTPLSSLLFN